MEFPGIPAEFKDLKVSPNPFDLNSKELTLKNFSKIAILFKVKCTSNKRIKIEGCADILRPGNETTVPIKKQVDNVDGDALYVTYTLVGRQWHDERMSAFKCWERAKKQAVRTNCLTIPIRKNSKTREEKGKNKDEKERDKDRSKDKRKEKTKEKTKDTTKSED
ncbi:hypothetical protein GCK72_002814 [Caenorhabditis remanei]|uniref:Major sperm protein n=1 Tax=Caenorhabditis remanei TaxID=31234 RepID=A0A6A5HS20_CAERE|nr:hypothetical protein GCK72_002814 [Caenorhabditis remanei]KAF1770990.1 hypothetical protein GCK72_002814 [Caenorhabditis remanei]